MLETTAILVSSEETCRPVQLCPEEDDGERVVHQARHKGCRSSTFDELKSLTEKRQRYEEGILKLSGAATLAQKQFTALTREYNPSCELCGTRSSSELSEIFMMRRMESARLCSQNAAKLASKQSECIKQIAKVMGIAHDQALTFVQNGRSTEWCNSQLKSAQLIALREQRNVSVQLRACAVCGVKLASENFTTFLREIDRQICEIRSGVHVHQQQQR